MGSHFFEVANDHDRAEREKQCGWIVETCLGSSIDPLRLPDPVVTRERCISDVPNGRWERNAGTLQLINRHGRHPRRLKLIFGPQRLTKNWGIRPGLQRLEPSARSSGRSLRRADSHCVVIVTECRAKHQSDCPLRCIGEFYTVALCKDDARQQGRVAVEEVEGESHVVVVVAVEIGTWQQLNTLPMTNVASKSLSSTTHI